MDDQGQQRARHQTDLLDLLDFSALTADVIWLETRLYHHVILGNRMD